MNEALRSTLRERSVEAVSSRRSRMRAAETAFICNIMHPLNLLLTTGVLGHSRRDVIFMEGSSGSAKRWLGCLVRKISNNCRFAGLCDIPRYPSKKYLFPSLLSGRHRGLLQHKYYFCNEYLAIRTCLLSHAYQIYHSKLLQAPPHQTPFPALATPSSTASIPIFPINSSTSLVAFTFASLALKYASATCLHAAYC